MLLLELKLNTNQDITNERTHLSLFIKFIQKNYRKKREIADEKKWILTVMIKRRLWEEFNSYWKFMCTDKNYDKNNKKLPPSSSSTPVTAYLIAEKY